MPNSAPMCLHVTPLEFASRMLDATMPSATSRTSASSDADWTGLEAASSFRTSDARRLIFRLSPIADRLSAVCNGGQLGATADVSTLNSCGWSFVTLLADG